MTSPHLLLGNANYSSWSLRAFLVMERSGLSYTKEFLPLLEPSTVSKMKTLSPVGLVPLLTVGDAHIGDSLAISEWAAEHAPSLWPSDSEWRAEARFLTAQMHGGFITLRKDMAMNLRRKKPLPQISETLQKEIDQVSTLWTNALSKHSGPYLLGKQWSIADAFYTPVAARFRSYEIELTDTASDYADRLLQEPEFITWEDIARSEEWVMSAFDADAPEPLGQLK